MIVYDEKFVLSIAVGLLTAARESPEAAGRYLTAVLSDQVGDAERTVLLSKVVGQMISIIQVLLPNDELMQVVLETLGWHGARD